MRVGLVVPGFSADASDWCIPSLRHLARQLAATDDVRVIAVRYPYRAARYSVDGADIVAIGGADRRGMPALDLWRTTLRIVQAEHRRKPFDVLHAFWATESGLLAAIAGRTLRVPTLVSLAGGELVGLRDIRYGDQRVAWERLKVRASLRLAASVSAGSCLLKEMAERQVPWLRVHRAPLGVDTTLFNSPQERSSGASPRRLVHVGTLTPVKDQATLLRAFAGVLRGGLHSTLELVGDGPERADLQRLARELGLDRSLCFRGEVDHASLPGIYQGASACIVSSRHEAQCMVALEAAACGVPVVGTRVGVVPELTSATAPVADPAALAQAMIATLTRGAPGRAAAERVESEFSLSTCTDRFRELYATLAAA